MIYPEDAQTLTLNADRLLRDIENYIDKILTIEMSGGKDEATVILDGYEYVAATYVLLPLIRKYEKGWIVEDVTGKKPNTYILRFTPRKGRG